MKCFYDVYSEIGNRSCNEDSYLAMEREWGYLFAVADGLGGHGSGDIASKIVVDTLKVFFSAGPDFDLCQALEEANRRIIGEQQRLGNDMMSTVAAAWVKAENSVFAHVGDSRIYVFDGKKIVFQTKDHSIAQIAVDHGDITYEQIRDYAGRNALLNAIGLDKGLAISTKEIHNDSFDKLLLCTDGFWEYVREREMSKTGTKLCRNACSYWIKKLMKIQKKRVPQGDDNATLIVVRRGGGHNG